MNSSKLNESMHLPEKTLSLEFLLKILNGLPDPIFVKDRQHRWIFLNDAFCKFIGHNQAELIGKSDHDFFSKTEADIFWQKDELVFTTGITNQNEELFTDFFGVTYVISTIKSLFDDELGNKFIVGIIRDITEYTNKLKSIEELLRKSYEEMELIVLERTQELAQINNALQIEISERKIAEKEQQKFFALVEYSNDLIAVVSLDEKLLYLNPSGKKILGLTSLEDFFITDLHHQDFLENGIEKIILSLDKQGFWQGEIIYKHFPTDAAIPCDCSVFIVNNSETEEPFCYVVVARDISIRKEAEFLLLQQEQFLRSIFDGIENLIFVVSVMEDGEFCYIGWNVASEKELGLEKAEVIGKTPEELLGKEAGRIARHNYLKCLRLGRSISYEECITVRGEEIWCLTTLNPIKDTSGIIFRIVGTTFNIAERKKAETRLILQAQELQKTLDELQQTQIKLFQSEKMSSLGQLVAGVAHEINNATSFIFGNISYAQEYTQNIIKLLQLYQKNYPNPVAEIQSFVEEIEMNFLLEDLPKLIKSMQVGADRICQIVLSLRNFSRLDEADIKAVDIHEGLDSTLMILGHLLKGKPNRPEIKIIKKYGDLPLVECFPGQLNQVFMNIIANAIDALEEAITIILNPSINITTELTENNLVVISIVDNGMGIKQEAKQKLFDPFFTTKPIGKGTGMGLSISYKIITEKHNGSLECLSQLGKGAAFIITIPLIQKQVKSAKC